MTVIDKIRAEIVRLKEIGGIIPFDNREQKTGYESALIDIEIFLDTLEEKLEKPTNLEGAVKEYFHDYWPGMETPEQCNTDLHFTPPAIMRLVKYFYELGLSEKPTNPLEGLDEAAYTIPLKLLTENKASYGLDSTGMRYPMDCFKAGAKWILEQRGLAVEMQNPDDTRNEIAARIERERKEYERLKLIYGEDEI